MPCLNSVDVENGYEWLYASKQSLFICGKNVEINSYIRRTYCPVAETVVMVIVVIAACVSLLILVLGILAIHR